MRPSRRTGTRRHAASVALAAAALVGLAGPPAAADVGSDRRPKSLLTPGASFELGWGTGMRFGGEVALTQYSGTWGFGAVAGFVPGRIYLEAQPAFVLGGRIHNLVLGINPGFVIEVSTDVPRYGGQLTVWGNYVRSRGPSLASPLFPFARLQAIAGIGVAFTGGLMLKLPIPVT